MQNPRVEVGSDSSDNVVHNVYPDGLKIPEHMMDPNIGGKIKKCRHIYEYTGTEICPDCGGYTHDPDFKAINAYNKQWLKDNPEAWRTVGWWSI